eukprot:CAMPEP_0198580110 /NCGR_PEP_ID=MMETSP1462-20131121/122420_1 /TAXON_ID=1333877 /ORGANISM="Brandtodinium nutriculum, Strain RCC3387" /LENGTH=73 /DNA_ID=CAMNT_0044311451 /DNA_START=58 /DNA_END=276 /DNA_ORIENTATION=-
MSASSTEAASVNPILAKSPGLHTARRTWSSWETYATRKGAAASPTDAASANTAPKCSRTKSPLVMKASNIDKS